MRPLGQVFAVSAIVAVGCSTPVPDPGIPVVSKPNPDEAKWGPDTIRLDEKQKYRWVKMTNVSMMGPGPAGLFIKLPEHSKTEPMLGAELLPKGKTAEDYNSPLKITTRSGGQVTIQLMVTREAYPEIKRAAEQPPADSTRVVARPWIGIKTEVPGGIGYTMAHPEVVMVVMGGGQTEKAKAEAEEASQAIVLSVRIDPAAKKIDFFPGAGEEKNRPIPQGTEVAMPDGMKIRATTKVGTIEIEAGPMSKRSYTWEGATRSVIMEPRGERWYGSKGLYYPGPGDHWEPHNGITRGVVEEGQQHFQTVDAAIKWLKERMWQPYVYRDDGLVVMWGKSPERHQLDVEVWQILINGKKPTKLPGSNNEAIVTLEAGGVK